jgi:BlaI family transcriptional regulator, penicillinase repressor
MKLDQITDGELSILQILWERQEAGTREIAEEVYGQVTDPKVATIQKLIERLEAKGCVVRDRSERAHRYRARVTREKFLRSRLQALADRLYDGAIAPLMTTLVRSKGLSMNECEELRKLIDEEWPSK